MNLTQGQPNQPKGGSERVARWLCTGLTLALVACAEQERPPSLPYAADKDASVHAQGGTGGRDADRDATEEGSRGGDAALGNPDGGGVSDSPLDREESDAGGSDALAQSWDCNGDYAYRASSLERFESPTPQALADALIATSRRAAALSLVLHLEDQVLFGTLSATIPGAAGKQVFPPNQTPPFQPAVLAFGSPPGVTTVDAQAVAFLHLVDEQGPVEIKLEHLVWRASEGRDCKDVSVKLQAVLPTSQLSVVLHLSGGDRTLGELVDASNPGGVQPDDDSGSVDTPVEIAVSFQGTPMKFDFSAGCCTQ